MDIRLRIALVAALLVTTVAPKILLERNPAQADLARFHAEVAAALSRSGFETSLLPDKSAIIGRRGGCRILVQNGDRARELGKVFQVKALQFGPVAIGYRGRWGGGPAASRSVFEQIAQDSLARMGVSFDRPAVIALASSPTCQDVRPNLAGIQIHSKIRRSF